MSEKHKYMSERWTLKDRFPTNNVFEPLFSFGVAGVLGCKVKNKVIYILDLNYLQYKKNRMNQLITAFFPDLPASTISTSLICFNMTMVIIVIPKNTPN